MEMVRLAVASQVYALAAFFLSLALETNSGFFIAKSLAETRRESLLGLGLMMVALGMGTFVPPFDDRMLWKRVSHGIGVFGAILFLLVFVSFNTN